MRSLSPAVCLAPVPSSPRLARPEARDRLLIERDDESCSQREGQPTRRGARSYRASADARRERRVVLRSRRRLRRGRSSATTAFIEIRHAGWGDSYRRHPPRAAIRESKRRAAGCPRVELHGRGLYRRGLTQPARRFPVSSRSESNLAVDLLERDFRFGDASRVCIGLLLSRGFARALPSRTPSHSLLVHSTSQAPAGWHGCVAGGAEEPRLARRVRSSKRRRHDAYAAPRQRRARAIRAAVPSPARAAVPDRANAALPELVQSAMACEPKSS
jgi:hypothetical protein